MHRGFHYILFLHAVPIGTIMTPGRRSPTKRRKAPFICQIRCDKRHFFMHNCIKDRLPRAIEAQILRQPLLNVKDIPHCLDEIARGGADPVQVQHSVAVARLRAGPRSDARLLRNQKRRERLQQRVVNAANLFRIGCFVTVTSESASDTATSASSARTFLAPMPHSSALPGLPLFSLRSDIHVH